MPENLELNRPLKDYIEFFEKLSARSVHLMDKVAHGGIYFKDPFNEVRGIEHVKSIFDHMFKTMEKPKFKVTDYAWGRDGQTAYIKWRFTYVMNGNAHGFEGVSEVTFGADGRVTSHIDHWDAGEHVYEKVPLLGGIIRLIKSKLAA